MLLVTSRTVSTSMNEGVVKEAFTPWSVMVGEHVLLIAKSKTICCFACPPAAACQRLLMTSAASIFAPFMACSPRSISRAGFTTTYNCTAFSSCWMCTVSEFESSQGCCSDTSIATDPNRVTQGERLGTRAVWQCGCGVVREKQFCPVPLRDGESKMQNQNQGGGRRLEKW
uniref:Uncharacterized protein n=1 Tax=Physcomitrium patens TaxID=3218 RepID=A0A2K1J4Z7_PHYPA|nr:hypothetical protein PHYPA_022455 [Physcomitrium patens]